MIYTFTFLLKTVEQAGILALAVMLVMTILYQL